MKSSALRHMVPVAATGALIVAWHFLFWICISPSAMPPRMAALAQGIRYIPVPDTGPGMGIASGQARAIWSPVLFSLPSEAGFSKLVLQAHSDIRPPLDTQEDLSVLLAKPDRQDAGSGTIVEPAGLARLARRHIERFAFKPVKEAFPEPAAASVVRIETVGGLRRAQFDGLELPGPLQQKNGAGWKLVVDLETDDLGFIRHAFVETSCGDRSLDQALIQTVYRLQLAGVTRSLRGKLILEKNGAALPAAAEDE